MPGQRQYRSVCVRYALYLWPHHVCIAFDWHGVWMHFKFRAAGARKTIIGRIIVRVLHRDRVDVEKSQLAEN